MAAVLKTVDLNGFGGSNPSLSAEKWLTSICEPHFLVHPQVKFVKIMSADFGGVDISWDEIFVMQ